MQTKRQTLLQVGFALAWIIPKTAWSQQRMPDWERVSARAVSAEQAGNLPAAERAWNRLHRSYPDAHDAIVALGSIALRENRLSDARALYEEALTLSQQESNVAMVGLAWTLLRSGHVDEAIRLFESLRARGPQWDEIQVGLDSAREQQPRAIRFYPSLFLVGNYAPTYPDRRWLGSIVPSVHLTFGDWVIAGLTYRATGYDTFNAAGVSTAAFSFQTHLLMGSLGIVRPGFSLKAHVGRAWGPTGTVANATVLGLSLRVAAAGDLQAEASASIYSDETVGRASLSWAFRLHEVWELGPTLSASFQSEGFRGSVGAVTNFKSPWFQLSIAGRWGDERRATFLNDSVLYATDDRVRGSVTTQVRVPLGRSLTAVFGYEWQRWVLQGTSEVSADTHTFTTGLLGSF